MNVFIKNHPALNVKLVRNILKADLSIQTIAALDKINVSDVIIMSQKDKSISKEEMNNYNIIFIEDIMSRIQENVWQEISNNYDYYYMKYQLSKAINSQIDTIITGSSYGLFGIKESMLPNAVNLSLASQDLYYSVKGIEYVWNTNKNIKHIIFCVSHYYFYSDLSKTRNDSEIQRIAKVYSPIFDDRHNCYLMPPRKNILYRSDIFDIESVLERTANSFYANGYFNDNAPRCNFATKIWQNNKSWRDLSYEEKATAGKQRAMSHNSGLNHINSLLVNAILFGKFVQFCKKNNISLTIVIVPASKYYVKHIAPQFKDIFYEVVHSIDSNLKILDYSNDKSFLDEDFNDMDHLSDSGAIKLTNSIVREYILGKILHGI